ncbi:MAG: type IV pilus secretin PilQ [Nitrospirota bacterium]|nr:type IV pilus secretin PilQ [Nitrospirota bacterium]
MKRLITACVLGSVLIAGVAMPQGGVTLQASRWSGERISLDFQDAQIRQVLQLITDVSGRNVVISDSVKGTVTLKLEKVPWDQALDLVLKVGGLGMEEEGNVLRIDTLTALARQRDEASRAEAAIESAESLTTRMISVHYAKPDDMKKLITDGQGSPGGSILSNRGTVSVEDRTKTLIVKEIASNMDLVAKLIRDMDRPTPQVTIEARIVQVTPTFSRNLGIQWGGAASVYGATSYLAPDISVNLPGGATEGNLGFSFGRLIGTPLALDLRLDAGETQGLNKVISSPKITVLDNEKASIQAGNQIPFRTVSSEGTKVQLIPAVLGLQVTPRITGDGRVSLEISVNKDAPEIINGEITIATRHAETTVLMMNGETTVIGGIYEQEQNTSTKRIPFLNKLPLIGLLFENNVKSETVRELLVFITPRIEE